MRLIDADKLMLSLADWELQEAPIHTYEKPKEFTADDMQRMIWRTIRDCESAVEEQPTVKAVTVDWIQNYVKKTVELANKPCFESTFFQQLNNDIRYQAETIIQMVKDYNYEYWEKENEKSLVK